MVSRPDKLAFRGWAFASKDVVTADAGLTLAVLIAGLLAIAIQTGVAIRGVAPILDGGLLDTDDYMRLVRVEYLWQTGAWFDSVIPRVDPPAGLALHWSRPMDVLLMAGALVGTPVLGFKQALFWWGSVISPVLQILSLIAMIWAAAPVISRQWLPLVAFFFVAQPANLTRFLVGRPDHHGLLILLLVLTVGFALRMTRGPERRSNAFCAGLVSALAIWVSVESLVTAVAVIGALGVCWLVSDRRYARAIMVYSIGISFGLAAALVIERGLSGFLAVEFDKISLPHPAMFAGSAVLWWLLASAVDRGWLGPGRLARAVWAGLGAMAVAATLLWFFPQILADPMIGGGELYVRKHLTNVAEVQPLLTWAASVGEDRASAFARAILWLGIALPAVPWVLYRCCVGGIAERHMWILLAALALAFVPLTAYQIRWASYAETILVLPYASLAAMIATRLAQALSEVHLSVARPLVMAGLCVWVFVPGILVGNAASNATSIAESKKACPLKGLSETLNDPSGLGARPKKILALIDFGPEILYRTPHSVLSIPNHRFQPGFIASYNIMSADDFSVAHRLLREKAVDLVVICPEGADKWFYKTEDGGRTLYQALSEGAPPPYLVPIPLPDDAGALRLYSVQPDF